MDTFAGNVGAPATDEKMSMGAALRIITMSLLIGVISGWLYLHQAEVRRGVEAIKSSTISPPRRNTVALGPPNGGGLPLKIPLRPMEEFDFLAREEVLERRSAAVRSYASLLSGPYEPSGEVFGAVESKKPWWGIEGLYFYGPGQQGPAGLSEESRFILNPFLLVGLIESSAWITKISPYGRAGYFPKPVELELSPGDRSGRVVYDLSGFIHHLRAVQPKDAENPPLTLVAYNARDLGFEFFSIDGSKSSGIRWSGPPSQPIPLIQFLHTGPSCGYPGGCNNMSPAMKEMELTVASFPARIAVKLWRDLPDRADRPADLEFTIEARAASVGR